MRVITVFLAALFIVSGALAQQGPSGPSVDETLKYLNERLDYPKGQGQVDYHCHTRIWLSLSPDHEEVIISEYFFKHNDNRKGMDDSKLSERTFIPASAVLQVTTDGDTAHPNVVISASGKVVKTESWQNCNFGRAKAPTTGYNAVAMVNLKPYTEQELANRSAKAFWHLVELLKAELDAKPASQRRKVYDPDKADPFADHN